jgi:SAM-dependent methyltransferase
MTVKLNKIYNKDFYVDREKVLESARIIVPLVLKLISPKSVIDIGCGTGEFLNVFRQEGIKDVLGVDGDWVNKDKLMFLPEFFMSFNLEEDLILDRRFNLVVCLETAEHLKKESAERFVKNLTELGDVILFSGAIPGQGGIGHLNEQLASYWVNLFSKEGYVVIDVIRKQIWNSKNVSFYYKQNTLLFVKRKILNKNPVLKKAFEETPQGFIDIIYPDLYLGMAKKQEMLKSIIPAPIRWIIRKITSTEYLLNKQREPLQ